MKKLLILFCSLSFLGAAQEFPPVEDDTAVQPESSINEDEVFSVVEQQAEFPGGQAKLFEFIASNFRYPDTKAEGKIYIRFVVKKDGKVENVTILRGIPDCEECNQEAIRVILAMPNWIPAQMNGRNVNSTFTLPIAMHR
ncbi:MAG: energy transducer TonB [Bacteroidota bacterium]